MAMAMAPAVVSGERLVVFLFVARVALAAPAQLAAPLAVLAAAALAVELAVDGSASASSSPLRRFRTSAGCLPVRIMQLGKRHQSDSAFRRNAILLVLEAY
ncbi:hypothetical protein OsJ_05363 [Oryza sativa Japonica Group]|uniref:Uncharacterized protein n=1 Tax=Oryza sativa subsp. japonica TaxID=39947 RepID=A3A339_ORYSJ|nr:hypothetical protein OsJ_05363 [Oryza sativa Japonica Group]